MDELIYFKKLAEHSTAKVLLLDAQMISMRNELEQKRRGFSLMAELAVTLNQENANSEDVFIYVSRRINAALNMHRTVVLVPDSNKHFCFALTMQGYPSEEENELAVASIEITPELLSAPVLVTEADPHPRLADFRKALHLPYFISAPVVLNNEVVAILVSGRTQEHPRFAPRLGRSDVETVHTVSTYMAAVLTGSRLQEAEKLASYDPLTKLLNLRRSQELFMKLVADRSSTAYIALMFMDLDSFKEVNDVYGHAAGDKVLQVVAERLTGSVRNTDLVCRIGGDEFVLILTHIKQPKDAAKVASKIIESVKQPINVSGIFCHVSASIGIAISPDNGNDWTTLTKAADGAMYKVKQAGKNSFRFAD